MDPNGVWWVCALTGGVAAGLFVHSFRSLYRAQLMRDIPTSRVRSAAQGYVELEGVGRMMDGPAIVCPLTGTHCLWWKFSVHKRVRRGKRSTWQAVRSGASDDLFYLDDSSGRCVIDPDGARVIPSRSHTWYGSTPMPERGPCAGSVWFAGDYRYREELITAGSPLYAIGNFRTQAARNTSNLEADARALLAQWKQDQSALHKRFDVNRDGHIDAREWEAARRVAHIQSQREQRLNPPPELPALHVMARSPDQPYLLSGVSQQRLTRRAWLRAATSFAGFLATGSICLWIMKTHGLL